MKLNTKEVQRLDDEWVELMQTAKDIGLSREEVRTFFQENGQVV